MAFDLDKRRGTPTSAGTIMSTRKQFGTNKSGTEDDVVNVGSATAPLWMTLRNAVEAGYLYRSAAGTYLEYNKPAAATRTNN